MSASARRNSSQFAGPSGVDQVNKIFQNGDKYTGGWKNNRPQGEGTYQWFDGSKYKGSWKEGRKDGLGTYYWPDGARYHGEWVHGAMHGVGTFEAPDGTSYQVFSVTPFKRVPRSKPLLLIKLAHPPRTLVFTSLLRVADLLTETPVMMLCTHWLASNVHQLYNAGKLVPGHETGIGAEGVQ